jgi:hypothetical protein
MMRPVKNITRKKILVKKIELADSVGKKTKGLMFRKSLAKGTGLLMAFDYERKHEIWMLGMRFPIDIIFIDSRKRIVDIKHSAKPMGKNPMTWRVYRPRRPCKYVLETTAGLANETGTKKGDVLKF